MALQVVWRKSLSGSHAHLPLPATFIAKLPKCRAVEHNGGSGNERGSLKYKFLERLTGPDPIKHPQKAAMVRLEYLDTTRVLAVVIEFTVPQWAS